MRQIAELSGGQFFTAASEEELRQVYAELGEQIGYEIAQGRHQQAVARGRRAAARSSGVGARHRPLGRRLP